MYQAESQLSVFHVRNNDPQETRIFLDKTGSVDIAITEDVKYPIFRKQAEAMFSNFWKPHEIVLTKDRVDYQNLTEIEQNIFTDNLKSQIVMDSVQSMAITQALFPTCSDASVKECVNYISFQEEVHAMSYRYIVKNLYNNVAQIYKELRGTEVIVSRAKEVSKYYDNCINTIAKYRLGLAPERAVKKALWLCINAINALEGLRFFASFAISFAFGQTGRMVGNASIIRMIANDELLHQAFTTALLRILPQDDPDFAIIERECRVEVERIFQVTLEQEEVFVEFVFRKGSLIGLNQDILKAYLRFMCAKRMRAIYLPVNFEVPKTNPLPWMSKWLNESEIQVAPQETEKTSYVLNIQSNLSEASFAGIEL
jgi:ribonucleoside-diphosphate reductase beta chain